MSTWRIKTRHRINASPPKMPADPGPPGEARPDPSTPRRAPPVTRDATHQLCHHLFGLPRMLPRRQQIASSADGPTRLTRSEAALGPSPPLRNECDRPGRSQRRPPAMQLPLRTASRNGARRLAAQLWVGSAPQRRLSGARPREGAPGTWPRGPEVHPMHSLRTSSCSCGWGRPPPLPASSAGYPHRRGPRLSAAPTRRSSLPIPPTPR